MGMSKPKQKERNKVSLGRMGAKLSCGKRETGDGIETWKWRWWRRSMVASVLVIPLPQRVWVSVLAVGTGLGVNALSLSTITLVLSAQDKNNHTLLSDYRLCIDCSVVPFCR